MSQTAISTPAPQAEFPTRSIAEDAASPINPLLLAFFVLSGATGLIYELIWTRELVFVFGGTTHAIATVLVAFMGGLGLGSWLAGRFAERITHPGRAYGAIEIAIGVYALLVPLLLALAEPLYRLMYHTSADRPWLLTVVRFAVGAGVLLVPTTLMGATLPILVRYVQDSRQSAGRRIGLLYGVNALGAVFGILAAGFLLLPALGLRSTTHLAAAMNILIGILAIVFFGNSARTVDHSVDSIAANPRGADVSRSAMALALITFAFSGGAAMMYQIAWTRVLVLSIGSSTYSFTCILAGYILGLSLGSLVMARYVDRWKRPLLIAGATQVAIGVLAAAISPVFGAAPLLAHLLVQSLHSHFGVLLLTQFLIIIGVLIAPTFLMGMLFPLYARIVAARVGSAAAAAGRAYAANTIGTILGSILAGFILIRGEALFDMNGDVISRRGLGLQGTLLAAALLNAALGIALLLWRTAPGGGASTIRLAGFMGAGSIVALALWTGRWDSDYLCSGPFRRDLDPHRAKAQSAVVYRGDGVDLTVGVARFRSDPQTLVLSVNGKPDASTAVGDMATQLLLAHIPMLLHPGATDVCVIGLGSGVTLSACARHPQIERIDCAEISEEVIRAGEYFEPFTYGAIQRDPRVQILRADGRNHLALTDRTYDVIISEPSNPWIAGVSNLFTREFFESARDRLRPGGVVTIWLQGYSISEDSFRLIVRTLADVLPEVTIWETAPNDYALIASADPRRESLRRITAQYETEAVRADLYRIGVDGVHQILGRALCGGAAVREWAGLASSGLHSDDNAILEFSAPRELFRGEDLKTLGALLNRPALALGQLVVVDVADEAAARLTEQLRQAADGRRLRLSYDESARGAGSAMDLARVALRAYELQPGELTAYERLQQVITLLNAKGDQQPSADVLSAAARARPPTLAHRTGESCNSIASRLMARAATSGWRLRDLEEAASLAPSRQDIAIELIYELVRQGRVSEAAQRAAMLQSHSP